MIGPTSQVVEGLNAQCTAACLAPVASRWTLDGIDTTGVFSFLSIDCKLLKGRGSAWSLVGTTIFLNICLINNWVNGWGQLITSHFFQMSPHELSDQLYTPHLASGNHCLLYLLPVCILLFQVLCWWGPLEVTESSPLFLASSDTHSTSAPTWKQGLGKTSNTKTLKVPPNRDFSLPLGKSQGFRHDSICLLYTSDAADEDSPV